MKCLSVGSPLKNFSTLNSTNQFNVARQIFVFLPVIWSYAHKITCTHISEKARAQIFAWVFGDRDIIYSLQHKQPFLMFIISHSCDVSGLIRNVIEQQVCAKKTCCLFGITVLRLPQQLFSCMSWTRSWHTPDFCWMSVLWLAIWAGDLW